MVLCLLILSVTCIGLAVIPTSAYWLLMVLRCIQAGGSASTVAVGEHSLLWTTDLHHDAEPFFPFV